MPSEPFEAEYEGQKIKVFVIPPFTEEQVRDMLAKGECVEGRPFAGEAYPKTLLKRVSDEKPVAHFVDTSKPVDESKL